MRTTLRAFLTVLLVLAWPLTIAAAQPGNALVDESFDGPALAPAWTVDKSAGNAIELRDGDVEIRAAENTYAHLQRPLTHDHIRASCVLQPGNGISWCTSLFLCWQPADWCQIGVIPRGDGRYYVCVTTRGQRHEHDLTRCRFAAWHHVGIELGEDCLRFVTSPDGTTWKTELFLPRPPELMGPPTLLIVGKGFGVDAGTPDLNGDYGDRGPEAVSRIRRVRVEPLPTERLRITDAERRARELADADPLGTAILERPGDPDYDTVAAQLPPLNKPREAVGVKDHPYEIGVEYDGTVQLAEPGDGWEQKGPTAYFELGTPPARFGTTGVRKRLLHGYLPIVITEWEHDGLSYEQTVLGWSEQQSPDRDLWACVQLRASNPGTAARRVDVALHVCPESPDFPPLHRTLDLPPGGSATLCFEVPSPLAGRHLAEIAPAEFAQRCSEVTDTWTDLLNSAMSVDVPEPRVNDAYRAWLAYNYLNVDKTDGRFEPHDGAGFYEAVFGYSAALYCHALDLWGRHDDARRYLESILTLLKPDGLFYVNYGLPDHGALLFALAEHYRFTRDADWLRRVAPQMQRMTAWLLDQRQKALAEHDQRGPVTRGLIKFAPYADYQNPTFSYYGDVYSCLGLLHAADVFKQVGLADDASRLAAAADAYRRDIMASMDAAQFERDGATLMPLEPDTRRHLIQYQYKCKGYYGLVASMLLEAELLPAADPRALLYVRGLERRGGLIIGMCEFDDGIDHAYTYGYWLNCLRRDDIDRVLLGFYGTLAYGMGRDTYCGVEVTQLMTGEPTPTTPHLYSGTQQLRLLRMMLLHEEGDELVIGRAIPRAWLAPGKRVVVRNAPTTFGPVSFTLESPADSNVIRVHLEPPTRTTPRAIRLVVRHPRGQPIASARLNGEGVTGFRGETLVLPPPTAPAHIELSY